MQLEAVFNEAPVIYKPLSTVYLWTHIRLLLKALTCQGRCGLDFPFLCYFSVFRFITDERGPLQNRWNNIVEFKFNFRLYLRFIIKMSIYILIPITATVIIVMITNNHFSRLMFQFLINVTCYPNLFYQLAALMTLAVSSPSTSNGYKKTVSAPKIGISEHDSLTITTKNRNILTTCTCTQLGCLSSQCRTWCMPR